MLEFLFTHLNQILPIAFVLAFLTIVLCKGAFGFFGWTVSRNLHPLLYWSVLTLLVLVLILGIWVTVEMKSRSE